MKGTHRVGTSDGRELGDVEVVRQEAVGVVDGRTADRDEEVGEDGLCRQTFREYRRGSATRRRSKRHEGDALEW